MTGMTGKWQRRGTALLVALVGAGLFAASAAGSYDSLWHLALAHDVPLPRLSPVELDGGLIGIMVVDVALTAAGYPIAWLRMVARLFGLGTVLANGAAGWPDPVSTGLRVFAPSLVIIVTEAARAVLLRHRSEQAGEIGIPVARWLLAPWPTFVLWRRMRLWDVRDYRQAVRVELSRRRAVAALQARHGARWKAVVPADVTWMLQAGVMMDEALARVTEILAAAPEALPAPAPAAPSGTAPEHAPETATSMLESTPAARPRARSAHASRPALKLTAARSRGMTPDKLAEHVEAMLDEYGDSVSVNKIKADLSVGTDKAKRALEIARSGRASVIPMERRQA